MTSPTPNPTTTIGQHLLGAAGLGTEAGQQYTPTVRMAVPATGDATRGYFGALIAERRARPATISSGISWPFATAWRGCRRTS
ncbi:MAG: hypothetical protein AB1679_17880 [Actinomycetota bacterium]